MAAVKKSKHPPAVATVPHIHLSSCESDSDDWLATKRQRVESVPKDKDKLLPDGFLDPLQPLKSKRSPKVSGNNNELERDENHVKRWFLLKLLRDHNKSKWRKNDAWVPEAWDNICLAFNQRFVDVNVSHVTKSQLRGRLYKIKKTYQVLKQLSELSGLKWDHTKNMLEGTEDVWQKLLHTNKDAKKWYNRPWPYYSECQELFTGKSEKQSSGADENGEGATTPVKISKKLNSLQELDEVVEINMNSIKTCSQEPSGTESIVTTKFSTEFKKLKGINNQCITDETGFSIKSCIEAFYKLNGFTTADLFKVGRIFKCIENREIFLSLTGEDREFWLRAEIDAD